MTRTAKAWQAFWKAEYGLAAVGSGLCLIVIMTLTVLSVLGRYVMHTDLIPGVYNMIERVFFPLMVFWALPLAHREGMFPKLELFMAARLSPRARGAVALVVGVVEFVVYAVLLWLVWSFVSKAIASNRTIMVGVDTYPLWPIAIMMPISFALMMVEMLRLIWRDMRMVMTGRAEEPDSPVSAPTVVM